MAHCNTCRILAVAVTSRGIGFAVMEAPGTLVDWGVKQPKPYREDRCVAHLYRLVNQYEPARVVLEDPTARPRRCSCRVERLFRRIREVAAAQGVRTRAIRKQAVRKAFTPDARITKFAMSRRIAEILPVLARRLPPYRKPWMSEDYRMAIFDAAALGLAYYHTLPRYRNFLYHHD